MSNIEWYVSFKDVELAQANNGGKNLEKTLYSLGLDTRRGYMDDGRWLLPCTNTSDLDEYLYFHRSLSGEKVCGPRYIGLARQDRRWRALVSSEVNQMVEFGQSTGKAA